MQIRCTQKLLKEINIKKGELDDIEQADSLLGNWYANIFTLDRRKTIIFMNERTLASFIVFGIRKDNIKNFPLAFIHGVEQLLTTEGIEKPLIDKVLDQYRQITLTKTDNKSLIGNMNDLVNHYTYLVLDDGGLDHVDLADVIARINRTPQRNIGWLNSAKALNEILNSTRQ
ncbi:MAG: hypothetical protein PVH98_06460 [Gammaproteobacteria bacterium]|jgi:hypothetical protein